MLCSSGADSLWSGGIGRAVADAVMVAGLGSEADGWIGVRDGRAREELRGGPWIRAGTTGSWPIAGATGSGGVGLSLPEYADAAEDPEAEEWRGEETADDGDDALGVYTKDE